MAAQLRGKRRASGGLSEITGLVKSMYIKSVPSYGNSFFFTIGIYLLELFGVLAFTGMVMVVFGPYWASLTSAGNFLRSVHLWAAEAFVTLILLHLAVNLSTSMYRHKKIVWMIGGAMLFLVLLEFAFGVGITGDFVAQFNAKAGADLWNGMGLGYWVNPLNVGAVYGWHIAIVPLLLVMLMGTHYMLVKKKGLSRPYRKDIPYSMVAADHRKMYARMVYILVIVLAFAILIPAPYSPPLTMQGIARSQPGVMALTLLNEFNYSSGTATYLDTIQPYTFSTRNVYVTVPYYEYVNLTASRNWESVFLSENSPSQNATLASAFAYFRGNGTVAGALNSSNPMLRVAGGLVSMAQDGVYGPVLQGEESSGLNDTYEIRFYSDSGILDNRSEALGGIDERDWGMLKVGTAGTGFWQVAQYWTAPYDFMEIITDDIPGWNDLQNGLVAVIAFIVLICLPYIPGLRDLPDRLGLYKLFWNRATVPEYRKRRRGGSRRGR